MTTALDHMTTALDYMTTAADHMTTALDHMTTALYQMTTSSVLQVTEIRIKYFDTVPVASSMSVLKTGFLFCASEFGNQ